MKHDFSKPLCYLGFGKSASRNERNKYLIGDGIYDMIRQLKIDLKSVVSGSVRKIGTSKK